MFGDAGNTAIPVIAFYRSTRFAKEIASVICTDYFLALYYVDVVEYGTDPILTVKWTAGEILRSLKNRNVRIDHFQVPPEQTADLIKEIFGKLSCQMHWQGW